MERALNPRLEKETIYEIYRACRLCGAGAGYKMPIVQNVVDLEDTELNLSKKIRECVQIEVHPDDKMPPLICELCVDKVNDFYEFLELCRHTNKRTRLKLGLPMQTARKGVPDTMDCILGDTSPVYINDDSDVEPLVKQKSKTKPKDRDKNKTKVKKEPEVKIKTEVVCKEDRSRACKAVNTPPTPLRVTRTSSVATNEPTIKAQEPPKKTKPQPKPIIKKEKEDVKIKVEEDLVSSKYKRLRSDKDDKPDVPAKKSKITEPTPAKTSKPSPKSKKPAAPAKQPAAPAKQPASSTKSQAATAKHPAKHPACPAKQPASSTKSPAAPARHPARHPAGPARSKNPLRTTGGNSNKSPACPARRSPSPASIVCAICSQEYKTSKGYNNHVRSHVVAFTKPMLACNACGEWFSNYEESSSHHRRHRNSAIPYKCRRCTAQYKQQHEYETHFANGQCIPYDSVPEVRCDVCWRYFPTDTLLINHKCAGEDGRPGGKCTKCNRTYILLKNLIRHESTCTQGKKLDIVADPEVLARLKPVQVRTIRCDSLIDNDQEHYDVSNVRNFGFDRNCVYPYRTRKIKQEPFFGMVNIHDEVKKEFCADEYVHWDSTDSEDEVNSLSSLALKTIFSQKFLGRTRKKRRVKVEVDNYKIRDEIVSKVDSILDNGDGKNELNCANVENIKYTTLNVKDSSTSKLDVSETHTDQLKLKDVDTRLENGRKQTDGQNGDEFGDDMENFNAIDDTNGSFEDIDSNKLIEALDAHIGDDNDDKHHNEEKENDQIHVNSFKNSVSDAKNGNIDESVDKMTDDENSQVDKNNGSFNDDHIDKSQDDNKDSESQNEHKEETDTESCRKNDRNLSNNHNDENLEKEEKQDSNRGESHNKNDFDRVDFENQNVSEKDEVDLVNGQNDLEKDGNDLENGQNSLEKDGNDLENSQNDFQKDDNCFENGENNFEKGGNDIENGKNNYEVQNYQDVEKIGVKDDQSNDKFSLEDLLSKDSDKNMDLESISDDDFNFDV